MGMSPGATERSAAQWADQDGNDMDPNPRPDGFHRADVRSLHEGPGFLQGVTPVGHHAPFSGSDDNSHLQAHWIRCKAGKRDAVRQGKGAALIAVGCRPATGCAGRVGGYGHWRSAAGRCWRISWRFVLPMPIPRARGIARCYRAAWGRWVGVAAAGLERCGGAAEAAAGDTKCPDRHE
jgi:hypothetical protein